MAKYVVVEVYEIEAETDDDAQEYADAAVEAAGEIRYVRSFQDVNTALRNIARHEDAINDKLRSEDEPVPDIEEE